MASVDRESSNSEIGLRKIGENRTRIAFDEDFEYAMFEKSDLKEMLQLAKDPRFSEFVSKHIFPVKYHKYIINIMTNTDEDDAEGNVFEYDKTLNLVGSNFYLDVIKHFGVSISNLMELSIHGADQISYERSANIFQYINEYCADSLTRLNLRIIAESTWAQFKRPFSKLTKLSFYMATGLVGSFQFLNETFPKLKHLDINFYEPTNQNECNGSRFIESEVPYMKELEQLDIFVNVQNASDSVLVHKQLENLFRNNPQIRILAFDSMLGDFIQVINKYLPNLQHFSVNLLDPEIQAAQLDHVKVLSVRSERPSPFERISFPSLESIDIFYSPTPHNDPARESWMKFFKSHQNIKTFSCTFNTDTGLAELLDELKHLNEIRLRCFSRFDLDVIVRFIESHDHLLKFLYQVHTSYQSHESVDIYHEKFGNQWNISHSIDGYWSTLLFEKKI